MTIDDRLAAGQCWCLSNNKQQRVGHKWSMIRKGGGECATFSSQWEAKDFCNEPVTNNKQRNVDNILADTAEGGSH
jgi:hypothetical protein